MLRWIRSVIARHGLVPIGMATAWNRLDLDQALLCECADGHCCDGPALAVERVA